VSKGVREFTLFYFPCTLLRIPTLTLSDQSVGIMRQILLGPFGSMGIMNMKMRTICLEDVFVESFLLMTALLRIITADTDYELAGALGSFIASSCISLTTSILVFDEGIQCSCFRNKPICTWCCCFWKSGVEVISDKALLKTFNLVSLLGICGALITIITECITFFDLKEVHNPVMHVPGMPVADKYIERDHAIIVICIQVCIEFCPLIVRNISHIHQFLYSLI
jgi:hypothetical protein